MNDNIQVMTFGKYKGQQVKNVIHEHFNYIAWAIDNVSFFKLDQENQELFNRIKKTLESRPKDTGPKYSKHYNGPVDIDFDVWDGCADAAPY